MAAEKSWQKLRTFEPAIFLHSDLISKYISKDIPHYPPNLSLFLNMAAGNSFPKRSAQIVDYKQLNAISSVVLYDTGIKEKKKQSCFYEVERVITRRMRKNCHGYEYLIKWAGWSIDSSTWEPAENLTSDLLRNYEKPPITDERLQVAALQFACGITSALRSQRAAPVYVTIDLDVWRYVVFAKGIASEHRGYHLYEKNDFSRFKYLPENWWYNLNGDGNGISVDFPLKAKPVLSWSLKKYVKEGSEMVEAKQFPIEKVCLTIIRKSCTAEQI